MKRLQEQRDAAAALLLVGIPLVIISLVVLVGFLFSEYRLWGWWSYYYGLCGPVPGFIGLALVVLGVRAGRSAVRRRHEIE